MYRNLAQFAAVDPDRVEWAAVVFTTTAQYQPPRVGNEVRWTVQVSPAGKLDAQGEADLYGTIAHEQVHAVQKSYPGKLPRWFGVDPISWTPYLFREEVPRCRRSPHPHRRTRLSFAAA